MSSSNVGHTIAPSYVAAARDVRYHSAAALTFLVWNFFVMLEDEVQYIWTMRNKNIFKWVYLCLRYGIILAHATHNFLLEQLANGTNPPMLCSMWYIYVLASSQTLATLLEFTLASRVFALYNRSKMVAFLLSVFISAEVVGTVRVLSLQQTTDFRGTCLLIQSSRHYKYQTVLGFSVHCTIIGLTWFKYIFALRAGWGRTPLVSLVVRDGSAVYATITFLLISVVIACGLQNERSVAIIFWTTSLMSISGCRMILSMERFARREVSVESLEPEFTSEFSIGTRDFGRTSGNHQRETNIAPPLALRLNGNMS